MSSENDPNEENDESATALIVASADVGVVKSGPGSVTAGTNISYTITVTNHGPDTAFGVTLDDPLPPDTTFVSLTQNNGPLAACNVPQFGTNGTVSCTFIALANGVSAQFTLVIEAGNTTSATNTATVTTDTDDGNPNNDSSTVITTVTPSADMSVTKNGPAAVDAGTDITYTVDVANNGPSDADNISLTDAVPANTTFVSATQNSGPTFTCITPPNGGTGTITCTIATLAPGAGAMFTFVLHVSPATPNGTSIDNTAEVSTNTPDPDPDDDSSTTSAIVADIADLAIIKSGPASAAVNTDITYTVSITNNGPADATTVSMTDNVPADTTFVSVTQTAGPTFSCATPPVGGTGTITCTIATLPSGITATFDIVFHVDPQATGTVANTATVTSDNDPTPTNSSTAITALAALAAVPTLSPFALALLALSLVGIVVFMRR